MAKGVTLKAYNIYKQTMLILVSTFRSKLDVICKYGMKRSYKTCVCRRMMLDTSMLIMVMEWDEKKLKGCIMVSGCKVRSGKRKKIDIKGR